MPAKQSPASNGETAMTPLRLTKRQMELIETALRIAAEDGSIYGADNRDAEINRDLAAIRRAVSEALAKRWHDGVTPIKARV